MRALHLYVVAACVACLASATPALAQEACTQAASHLSDCSAQYCALPGQSPECIQRFVEATAELTAEGTCDAALADEVLWSSCARLSSGVGSVAGNPCVRAVAYLQDCAQALCMEQPDHPICGAMDSMGEVPECGEMQAEMAEHMLEMSCDEIFGF